jgi:hypothetical protein
VGRVAGGQRGRRDGRRAASAFGVSRRRDIPLAGSPGKLRERCPEEADKRVIGNVHARGDGAGIRWTTKKSLLTIDFISFIVNQLNKFYKIFSMPER